MKVRIKAKKRLLKLAIFLITITAVSFASYNCGAEYTKETAKKDAVEYAKGVLDCVDIVKLAQLDEWYTYIDSNENEKLVIVVDKHKYVFN